VACREEKTLGSLETTFKKATNERTAGKWGAWAQELRNIALHPEQHSPAALEVTNEAVVIADKFAKVNTINLSRQVNPQVWRIISASILSRAVELLTFFGEPRFKL